MSQSHVLNHATITDARSEGVDYALIVSCARTEASEIAASWGGVEPWEVAEEASALEALNAHLSMQGPLEPLWSDPNFRDLVARELHRSAPTLAPEETLETFVARFVSRREAIAFEHRALTIGSEFLPKFVRDVRDHVVMDAGPAYWAWLVAQHEAS